MAWALANASKSVAANATGALANGGSVKIYNGTRPATPDTAITTQTLLATLTFSATAFGAAVNGVAAAAAISSGSAVATGTASWARAFKSDGVTVMGDCDVSTSGADVNFPSVSFVAGALIPISSLTLTQP